MIVKVVITPEAIRTPGVHEQDLVDFHRGLATLILNHGLVVYADNEDRERVARAIQELPNNTNPPLRQLWEKTFKQCWWTTLPPPPPPPPHTLDQLDNPRSPDLNEWSQYVQVALVPRGSKLLPPRQGAHRVGTLEIVPAARAGYTNAFRTVERRKTIQLWRQEWTPEQIAADVFIPLMEGASGEIVCVDRYVGARLAERHGARGPRPRRGEDVGWFLELILSHARQEPVVKIATSGFQTGAIAPQRSAIRSGMQALLDSLALSDDRRLGFRRLELYVAPKSKVIKRGLHDRAIRFERRGIVTLGRGLDWFKGSRKGDSLLTYLPSWGEERVDNEKTPYQTWMEIEKEWFAVADVNDPVGTWTLDASGRWVLEPGGGYRRYDVPSM